MFKIAFLILALCSAILAETSLKKATSLERDLPKPGYKVSHPAPVKGAGAFKIPPDNGFSNYGDNLWEGRDPGDALLTREVQLNPISYYDQTFDWNCNFPGKSITHIRFLNFGRQRAWVESITSNGGSTASAKIHMTASHQFRLLIEVYGK